MTNIKGAGSDEDAGQENGIEHRWRGSLPSADQRISLTRCLGQLAASALSPARPHASPTRLAHNIE